MTKMATGFRQFVFGPCVTEGDVKLLKFLVAGILLAAKISTVWYVDPALGMVYLKGVMSVGVFFASFSFIYPAASYFAAPDYDTGSGLVPALVGVAAFITPVAGVAAIMWRNEAVWLYEAVVRLAA